MWGKGGNRHRAWRKKGQGQEPEQVGRVVGKVLKQGQGLEEGRRAGNGLRRGDGPWGRYQRRRARAVVTDARSDVRTDTRGDA